MVRAESVVASAPGRVNLVGEHTDYNGGLVLPLAVDRRTTVAAAARDDGVVRGRSAQLGDGGAIALADLPRAAASDRWLRHVAGVVWAMNLRGAGCAGLTVEVESTVPLGAGLASSAALGCAVAVAVDRLCGTRLPPLELAEAARQAERDVVGAPVGLMDQAVAMLARPGSALLLDCRSLEHEQVPVPFGAGQVELLVVDTRVRHSNAAGGYAARRDECAAAAAALGVASLRDATPDSLSGLDPVLRRRARHVVTENARVTAAAWALRHGDPGALGAVLVESHVSLRDDFEVSVPELDVAVTAALDGGALGARMTGGGFGGAAILLVEAERAEPVTEAVRAAFGRQRLAEPGVFPVRPGEAARVDRSD
jgi:galactokinase